MTLIIIKLGRMTLMQNDMKHNDNQQNDIRHNDIKQFETQQNDNNAE